MRQLISFFIKRPVWANSILILIIIFGVVSVLTLDRSFFPIEDPNRISVSVFYNGASPQEMEEGVTIKVEQAIKGIQGVEKINSYSYENFSRISIIAFKSADIDEVLRDVDNAVRSINNFPAGAEKPTVVKQRSYMNSRAAFMALYGDADLSFLIKKAKRIEEELLKNSAISSVSIGGYPAEEYQITVTEEQLQRYNLTFDDIISAFSSSNVDVSSGEIKTKDEIFTIRLRNKKKKIHELEHIIIRSNKNSRILRLKDVASINIGFNESPNKFEMNGKQALFIQVNRLENEDLGDISDAVNAYVDKFNAKNKDVRLLITFEFYELLKERIITLVNNGITGLILVLIVLGLFLSLRLSFWVAMGIPISFLGMFILGSLVGITINMISLFGMILVVGILVDDGIVVAENIYMHYENGKSPMQATVDGTLEVAYSVITSVLTTIVAFGTLLFVEGMERMYEMALCVIFALSVSLVEAFLILPIHLKSKNIIKKKKNRNFFDRIRNKLNKGISFLRDTIYIEFLNFLISSKGKRRLFAFIPLLFIILTYVLLGQKIIKSTFFPAIDFDDVTISASYKPGSREDKTEHFLKYCYNEADKLRLEINEKYGKEVITHISMYIGSDNNEEEGPHCGNVSINMDLSGVDDLSGRKVADMVRKRITPDPLLEKFKIGAENRFGNPIEISIESDDYNDIIAAKDMLQKVLYTMPELKDITNNAGMGKREVIFELNDKAIQLGFTHKEIAKQIRQGFFGQEVQRLIIGKDELKVWVRYDDESKKGLDDFEKMKIKGLNGQQIPITELINYKLDRGIVSIFRHNTERNIFIEADQKDPLASTSEINDKIEKEIFPKIIKKFPNVELKHLGQVEEASKAKKSMTHIVIILIIILILILSLNFNSFYQALLFIPIILIGPSCAILGHGIENQPVSLLSSYGIIALIGVLINDAVVFLDKFNRCIKAGKEFKDAIIETAKSRFRPIILTTITTSIGLYPLILEDNFQVQFLIPMAISVVYGIVFGTFFILVFFPLLIWMFNDIKRFFTNLKSGNNKTAEQVESAFPKMDSE